MSMFSDDHVMFVFPAESHLVHPFNGSQCFKDQQIVASGNGLRVFEGCRFHDKMLLCDNLA